jgi:predicted nuclease with TOPRIM domain
MMEDETRQLLIDLFRQLKKDINDVKTDVKIDINAVTAGQEELKTEINAGQEELKNDISAVKDEISAVKNDIENSISDNISALETKIKASQEELRQEINAFQERIKNIEAGQPEFEERVTRKLREDLSRNIEAGQAEFEERVTCAVDALLKNVLSMVERPDRPSKPRDATWRPERDVRVVAARGPTLTRTSRLSSMDPQKVSCFNVSLTLRPSITIGPPERRPLTS